MALLPAPTACCANVELKMNRLIAECSSIGVLAIIFILFSDNAWSQPPSPNSPKAQAQWSEYVFQKDGFAARFPNAPSPHKDSSVPDGTAYTMTLPGSRLTLHVANYPEGCRERFADYVAVVKNTKKSQDDEGKFLADPKSIREMVVGGYPAIEHEQIIKASQLRSYERWQCVGQRFYIFTAVWSQDEPRPPEVARIVESFRLLPK